MGTSVFSENRVEEIPTLDSYIGLKLSLEQLEWRNKVLERQKNIETLKKQNERAKREKEKLLKLLQKKKEFKGPFFNTPPI